MSYDERPEIPAEEYNKPIPKSDRKPLPLLPEREWLEATITEVKYQVAMFMNKPQVLTNKDGNPILDADGNEIIKKEFEITFEYKKYYMPPPDDRKRNSWLRIGASRGEKAHLPKFLANVLFEDVVIETPKDVINALTGIQVELQLKNKLSSDGERTYQNVIYDAVRRIAVPTEPPKEPEESISVPEKIDELVVKPEDVAWDED